VTSRVTPAQTIGPFFHGALCRTGDERLVDPASAGALELAGRVSDGAGAPVTDALVELWCTDGQGSSAFGRAPTDGAGEFRFTARKPAAIPGPGESMQAPHLCVSLFARGLLHRLVTRIYFPDEAAANARDPLLGSIEPARRALLVARSAGADALRFDIVLQGPAETPFLDV
jgi:protocatechuate 3,4-dioxygenase alpha subunit